MNLEPRENGDPITLRMSGREFYLLRMGLHELSNQIDDDDLQIIIGTDRGSMDSVSNGLGEIWWHLDDSERWAFTPGGRED